MSDDIQHINVDDDQWDGTPRALREYVDKLQKANAALTQQISGFQAEKVSSALSDVLTGFKNPERVKSALLGDKVDPLSNEAVTAWLESNGDDYARATANSDASQQEQAEPVDRSKLDMSGFQGGSPDVAAVLSSVPQDLSPEQTRLWLIQHGA